MPTTLASTMAEASTRPLTTGKTQVRNWDTTATRRQLLNLETALETVSFPLALRSATSTKSPLPFLAMVPPTPLRVEMVASDAPQVTKSLAPTSRTESHPLCTCAVTCARTAVQLLQLLLAWRLNLNLNYTLSHLPLGVCVC